jgi:SAM-dependent methyltransferase
LSPCIASATTYGADLAAIHAAGFTGLATAAAEELLAWMAPRSRVVELGCGDGTTARRLSEAGHEVHAIDASPAFVELARRNAPRATVVLGSFADAALPGPCDAVIAVGEVLRYMLDDAVGPATLDAVLARAAPALIPGGLLLCDLAGPGRAGAAAERTWTEAHGWAVLVETTAAQGELRRRIVTFRGDGAGGFRRGKELHRLHLHAPADVLARLRAAGFSARTLRDGYAGTALPRGVTAYLARRR